MIDDLGKYSEDLSVLAGARPDLADHVRALQLGLLNSGSDAEVGSVDRYRIHTAIEALEPQPPIEMIVENLLLPGTVNVFYGDPGAKKTRAVQDLAACVAAGLPWLDFATQQAPVLWVDEEEGEAFFKRQLAEVLRGHFLENNPPPFYFISLAAFDLNNPDCVNALYLAIVQTGARLVVLDALTDFIPGIDENSTQGVTPVFLALRRVASQTRSAVVILHHANKAGGYRGTTALKGHVNLLLKIESRQGEASIDFDAEKARFTGAVKFSAVANFNNSGQFWLSLGEAREGQTHYSKSQRYVLRHLSKLDQAALPDIEACAEICSGSAARQAVYNLADRGLVERSNPGESGKGIAAIYRLSEAGRQAVKDGI